MPIIDTCAASSPSPPSPLSPTDLPQRTNTLVITSLPAPFFHPDVMAALHNHFELFGNIYAWAPLRAFARVIIVYQSEDDAELSKVTCDGLSVESTTETYVYFFFFFFHLPAALVPQSNLHEYFA